MNELILFNQMKSFDVYLDTMSSFLWVARFMFFVF